MIRLSDITEAFLHLIFPMTCEGCGSDLRGRDSLLCLRCAGSLPLTGFEWLPGNPVEKRFYGRLPLMHAAAFCYFSRGSLLASLVHQVKYKGNKELGIQLGRMMGDALKRSGRFDADGLLPLPLFPARERKRGYNQSRLLCEGMAEHLSIPVLDQAVARPHHTETQTKKGRIERWKNMEGKFVLHNPGLVTGRHILLVDDVITTGATLESCGAELLKAKDSRLSIACLCHALR